ncbi:unnamed protein product [Chrysoparadoxa australica]
MRFGTPSTDDFVLRGKIKWALGKNGRADLEEAEKRDPEHPEVLLYYDSLHKKSESLYESAKAAIERSNDNLAVEHLGGALKLTPTDLKLLVMRAGCYRRLGSFQQALDDLTQASVHHYCAMVGATEFQDRPEDEPGAKVSDAEYRRLKYDKARSSATFKDPSYLTEQKCLVYNELGLKLHGHGLYTEAITAFNLALEAAETTSEGISFRLYLNRGDCSRELSRLPAALADYHRALGMEPKDWGIKTRISLIHYLQGTELFNKGAFLLAKEEFDTCIRFNDKVPGYFICRGQVLFFLGDKNGALADYKKACHLDPSNREAQDLVKNFDSEGHLAEVLAEAERKRQSEAAARAKQEKLRKAKQEHKLRHKAGNMHQQHSQALMMLTGRSHNQRGRSRSIRPCEEEEEEDQSTLGGSSLAQAMDASVTMSCAGLSLCHSAVGLPHSPQQLKASKAKLRMTQTERLLPTTLIPALAAARRSQAITRAVSQVMDSRCSLERSHLWSIVSGKRNKLLPAAAVGSSTGVSQGHRQQRHRQVVG